MGKFLLISWSKPTARYLILVSVLLLKMWGHDMTKIGRWCSVPRQDVFLRFSGQSHKALESFDKLCLIFSLMAHIICEGLLKIFHSQGFESRSPHHIQNSQLNLNEFCHALSEKVFCPTSFIHPFSGIRQQSGFFFLKFKLINPRKKAIYWILFLCLWHLSKLIFL